MPGIALLGDISLNGIISSDPQQNLKRFETVCQLLSEIEIVFANLEVPVEITGSYNKSKKLVGGYADKEVTFDLLNRLNIGCVSLANNHILDCGIGGIKATIGILERSGIYYTGAGWKREHLEPVIIESGIGKIGFMAYVDKTTNPDMGAGGDLKINYFEPDSVLLDIAKLKGKADIIICSIHWGSDYSNFFTEDQQLIAQSLIQAGADIVMGHHPHVIQPYVEIDGKYIFYSLGQLCFGDFVVNGKLKAIKRKTKEGMIPILDSKGELRRIVSTKEEKGNYIKIPKRNIERKLKRLLLINRAIIRSSFIKNVFALKEALIDRFAEFFFGYYRNPFQEMFKSRNYKKIKYIYRDYNSLK